MLNLIIVFARILNQSILIRDQNWNNFQKRQPVESGKTLEKLDIQSHDKKDLERNKTVFYIFYNMVIYFENFGQNVF